MLSLPGDLATRRCVGQERILRRRGEDRKSRSPPCRKKRDKDGAPSGVQMKEKVGQPPEDTSLRG